MKMGNDAQRNFEFYATPSPPTLVPDLRTYALIFFELDVWMYDLYVRKEYDGLTTAVINGTAQIKRCGAAYKKVFRTHAYISTWFYYSSECTSVCLSYMQVAGVQCGACTHAPLYTSMGDHILCE